MTSIDFYQVSDQDSDAALLIICKLIRKALRQHNRIYVQVQEMREAERLDELLWSFDRDSFLPHVLLPRDHINDAPIVIGVGSAPNEHDDLLINFSKNRPERYARFQRICELVPADETARQQARDNYKHYKERGYVVNYHHV